AHQSLLSPLAEIANPPWPRCRRLRDPPLLSQPLGCHLTHSWSPALSARRDTVCKRRTGYPEPSWGCSRSRAHVTLPSPCFPSTLAPLQSLPTPATDLVSSHSRPDTAFRVDPLRYIRLVGQFSTLRARCALAVIARMDVPIAFMYRF